MPTTTETNKLRSDGLPVKTRRKICVVTGTRAEYGLLYWLLREIQEDKGLDLQLAVTGAHLSPRHGETYKIIEEDGFRIDTRVEILSLTDTPVEIAKSIGRAVTGFAEAFDQLKPDVLVLLGDRYEVLAAAQAALILRIPIAHIHGGESTEGLIDEAIRHSVTKMCHFHFVAAEAYRQRVLQLGEQPERVMNFGAIGLDNIARLKLIERDELQEEIGFRFGAQNFLVTYHPVTLDPRGPKKGVNALLEALDRFPSAKVIFTSPNADTDSSLIRESIERYVAENSTRAAFFVSLGQLNYLSCIRWVDVVIGNSSSGVIEVPMLKKPTINIGDRQRGRLKAPSILDCRESEHAIVRAIEEALSPEFQKITEKGESPYGAGNVSVRIKNYLEEVDLSEILMKRFYAIE